MRAHDLRSDGQRAAAGDGADKQQRRGFGRNAERIERGGEKRAERFRCAGSCLLYTSRCV